MNLFFGPILAFAATPPAGGLLNSIGVTAGSSGHGVTLSVPLQIALGLTLLTILPAAVMCITPFLRIIVVLHFLRQALGTQTAPSNQVLLGLALFLAMLIVQPVASDIYTQAWEPQEKGQITADQAFDQGAAPLRKFMVPSRWNGWCRGKTWCLFRCDPFSRRLRLHLGVAGMT